VRRRKHPSRPSYAEAVANGANGRGVVFRMTLCVAGRTMRPHPSKRTVATLLGMRGTI
jgi:hypothetical protein